MRTITACGLAIVVLHVLSACAPAYYPVYPAYYGRPAYPAPYHRAPSQAPTGAQPRSSDWINPEPAR